jgi:hypothetical protein
LSLFKKLNNYISIIKMASYILLSLKGKEDGWSLTTLDSDKTESY